MDDINPVDPKLKEAAAEITELLKRHDIAGLVLLSSGERCEYVNYIAAPFGPTWSAFIREPQGVRFRAKGRRNHTERYKLNTTVKMAFSMRGLLGHAYGAFHSICEMLEQNLDLEHGEEVHIARNPPQPLD